MSWILAAESTIDTIYCFENMWQHVRSSHLTWVENCELHKFQENVLQDLGLRDMCTKCMMLVCQKSSDSRNTLHHILFVSVNLEFSISNLNTEAKLSHCHLNICFKASSLYCTTLHLVAHDLHSQAFSSVGFCGSINGKFLEIQQVYFNCFWVFILSSTLWTRDFHVSCQLLYKIQDVKL